LVSTLSQTEITDLRAEFRKQVVANLQQEMNQVKKKNHFPRVQFLKRFILYDGLARFTNEHLQEQQSGSDLQKDSAPEHGYEADLVQHNLMQIFNCNPEWPICLFDFTIKNKCPNFFRFRVR